MELPPPGTFFAAVAVWSAFALLVFAHAERNGNKRATAWGVATFLVGPMAVPLYFARHWLLRRGKR